MKDQFRFKTIALATDLSGTDSAALQSAQSIARANDSTLVLIHVIDPLGYAFPRGIPEMLSANLLAREELRRIENEAHSQGIQIHSVVESGIVCERILQSMQDHNADLLILGTKGRTEAGPVALGTVARQLLARSRCPIMTVSPMAAIAAPWTVRCRRILVATDFSAASISGLRWAQETARRQVIALHVTRDANDGDCLYDLEKLRSLTTDSAHNTPIEHLITTGIAGQQIAAYADKCAADLVVLGSPENELTEEEFQSSTVLQVISHVTCPVLCMPVTWDSLIPGFAADGQIRQDTVLQ